MAGAGSNPDPNSVGTMPKIVQTEGVLGGDPRIEGHRIGVYHVYHRYVADGKSPEQIATAYDISVAEVHAALAYAFSNISAMRTIEERNQRLRDQSVSDRIVPDESS